MADVPASSLTPRRSFRLSGSPYPDAWRGALVGAAGSQAIPGCSQAGRRSDDRLLPAAFVDDDCPAARLPFLRRGGTCLRGAEVIDKCAFGPWFADSVVGGGATW